MKFLRRQHSRPESQVKLGNARVNSPAHSARGLGRRPGQKPYLLGTAADRAGLIARRTPQLGQERHGYANLVKRFLFPSQGGDGYFYKSRTASTVVVVLPWSSRLGFTRSPPNPGAWWKGWGRYEHLLIPLGTAARPWVPCRQQSHPKLLMPVLALRGVFPAAAALAVGFNGLGQGVGAGDRTDLHVKPRVPK